MNPCCCGGGSCLLGCTSVENGFCTPSGGGADDFGVWTSAYSVGVPTPTVTIKNSAGGSVTNPSNQPAGSYTATSTVPTSLCASVTTTCSTIPVNACISYAGPVTSAVTHSCPDTTHTIPAPAFTGWQVALSFDSSEVSNDSRCAAHAGPSGTGVVDGTGQTFSIPGCVVLNSNGTDLTITGTYNLTGSICCNTAGPGTPLATTPYTISGSFSFDFCDGPCASMTVGVSCGTVDGSTVVSGSVLYAYCTPTGLGPVHSTVFGDLGSGSGPIPMSAPPQTPGLITMAANLGKSLVAHVADGARQASAEVVEKRRSICESCPLFIPESDRCSSCGCYLSVKQAWASSACPEGHWGPDDEV